MGPGNVEMVAEARDRLQQETNFANGAPRRSAPLDYIICGIWPTGKHNSAAARGHPGQKSSSLYNTANTRYCMIIVSTMSIAKQRRLFFLSPRAQTCSFSTPHPSATRGFVARGRRIDKNVLSAVSPTRVLPTFNNGEGDVSRLPPRVVAYIATRGSFLFYYYHYYRVVARGTRVLRRAPFPVDRHSGNWLRPRGGGFHSGARSVRRERSIYVHYQFDWTKTKCPGSVRAVSYCSPLRQQTTWSNLFSTATVPERRAAASRIALWCGGGIGTWGCPVEAVVVYYSSSSSNKTNDLRPSLISPKTNRFTTTSAVLLPHMTRTQFSLPLAVARTPPLVPPSDYPVFCRFFLSTFPCFRSNYVFPDWFSFRFTSPFAWYQVSFLLFLRGAPTSLRWSPIVAAVLKSSARLLDCVAVLPSVMGDVTHDVLTKNARVPASSGPTLV